MLLLAACQIFILLHRRTTADKQGNEVFDRDTLGVRAAAPCYYSVAVEMW